MKIDSRTNSAGAAHPAKRAAALTGPLLAGLLLAAAASLPAAAQTPALKPSTSIASIPASVPAATAPTAAYDARATGTAQLLAGIQPTAGDAAIDRLAALPVWKAHAQKMQQDWALVKARLGEMEKWRDRELSIRDADKRTLLYPFSGPDYLNASVLFPTHKQYVFFSLENPGKLPDVAVMNEKQFAKLLENTRGAMRDIFQRNYFITDYMNKQLSAEFFKGTVPVMSIMMALNGKRIVRTENIDMFPDLTKQYLEPASDRPRKRLSGVRIDFVDAKTGFAQQLTYYSLDATDKALEYYPAFLDMIGRNKPATGFIKSASYLLHDQQFKKTRDMMLGATEQIVQDDTGIPYRFFAKTSWQVKLYGQYEKPIRGLTYGNQPDLKVAYEAPGAKPTPISFPFGYHWKNGKSGLMVATRQ
jgi:hypothetical protein